VLAYPCFQNSVASYFNPEEEEELRPDVGGANSHELPPATFVYHWGATNAVPRIVEALMHKCVLQVSVGRYHVAAVTWGEGELFTWSEGMTTTLN